MKLYIVMPVINCLELTQAAIDSIGSSCKIILIDNASTDGTPRWGEMMDKEKLLGNKELVYVRNNERKGVAASWNQGIRQSFEDPECEYVAVLNNDILLHKKTLEHLMRFMDKTGYLMVTGDNVKDRMSAEILQQLELPEPFTDFDTWKIEGWRAEGPDFSCFMVSRETIRVIGWFDENFQGAYCEDQDYHARCERARRHIGQHKDQHIPVERVHFKRLSTAPYFHFASETLKRNADLRSEIYLMHGRNQSYYVRKWGGEHPFVMDQGGFTQPFGDATKNWRDW